MTRAQREAAAKAKAEEAAAAAAEKAKAEQEAAAAAEKAKAEQEAELDRVRAAISEPTAPRYYTAPPPVL